MSRTPEMTKGTGMPAPQTGFGPVDGEYYDDDDGNKTLGVGVLWSGKTIAKRYEDRSGLTRVEFTDGSVADLFHRTVSNTGPGGLILATKDCEVIAK
jgi:hypothetical protein